ncbi:TonB system biopolymer transport component [gamma proteobacterium HTCC5015]|nr:TonB system biopolymer transport component [gamma proteobacterium HTCC5015]
MLKLDFFSRSAKWALQPTALCFIALAAVSGASQASDLDKAINSEVARTQAAQSQQNQIDQLDSSIREETRDYYRLVKEIEGLNVYVKQMSRQVTAQEEELQQIEDSIKQVTLIERQVVPLMLKMIDSIEQFVKADVPFMREERTARVENLKALMDRADVSAAEKFRKVMEAYQTEMTYGRTIKAYRGELTIDGTQKAVDFLRVGRISLMYQSLDGQAVGAWDQQAGQWSPLGSEYKSRVAQGIRIAREQAAPDLIKVPVAAPVTANKEAQ